MITTKNILDKIESKSIFSESKEEDITKYIQRETTIKNTILRTIHALHVYDEKKEFLKKKDYWKLGKVKQNEEILFKYLERLLLKLNKNEIIKYCNESNSFTPLTREEDDILLILVSYYSCIEMDILWDSDISVLQAIKISQGKLTQSDLLKNLPCKVRFINKTILPFIEKSKLYNPHYKILRESMKSYEKKLYCGCNLLLLVSIEGLVRDLGYYLIDKQALDKSKLKDEYSSLDSFLREIPWKKDIEIDSNKLLFINSEYKFREDKTYDINPSVNVDLKNRLDFLRRRFKEDRNLILHGLDTEYGNPWNLYMNFSALTEVFMTIKSFENKY